MKIGTEGSTAYFRINSLLKNSFFTECSKRIRFKAAEMPRNEAYKEYVAMTRDEDNTEDEPFSAPC
jgi:hypothetical protein